ncbi:MAG: C39 family peptidase [Acidobacteria bacterium]|nr:C39 family peptidase [Acidobacteriota bacterium]
MFLARRARFVIPLFAVFFETTIGFGAAPWLDVPFVRQVGAGCGAAAAAMVIQYWAARDPRLAAAAAGTERINEDLPAAGRGIPGKHLKAYLEERGFEVFVFNGDRADLENEFRKGRPLVVCFAPRGARGPLHYAVVAGVDGKAVWLNDPARGKLIREPLRSFQPAWNLTENWSLLAVPKALR